MIIKDWWYAYKVCRKYGIQWNPFRGTDNASFSVRWDGDRVLTEKKIHMSPFYPHFLETFMHEVGHILLYKRGTAIDLFLDGKKKIQDGNDAMTHRGRCFLNLLVEESLASRFARKSLKGKADTRDLVTAFNTYSAWGYSRQIDAPTVTKLTDTVAKCTRRIEK
jgi:hypothetical protein